jgi:hypothetical protein
MNEKNIRDLLEGVHDELQRVESVDEKGRVLLRDLDADIRDLLERSGDEEIRSNESVQNLLRSAMDHFEISHPKLTIAISEMLNALNNAGI